MVFLFWKKTCAWQSISSHRQARDSHRLAMDSNRLARDSHCLARDSQRVNFLYKSSEQKLLILFGLFCMLHCVPHYRIFLCLHVFDPLFLHFHQFFTAMWLHKIIFSLVESKKSFTPLNLFKNCNFEFRQIEWFLETFILFENLTEYPDFKLLKCKKSRIKKKLSAMCPAEKQNFRNFIIF